MAITRQAGPGMGLNNNPLLGNSNRKPLAAGLTHLVASGQYYITCGPYTQIETLDPITGEWQGLAPYNSGTVFVSSDGQNVRIANRTGCVVGVFMTNNGGNYTSAPAVTGNIANATYQAIVGGAVSTTLTITAGAGYNYIPTLAISAPAPGGVQATGYIANLTAGGIGNVTLLNQGAGYATAPTFTVIPDPRESLATAPGPTTAGAVVANLTGNGTVTAVLVTNQGTPVTSVPALTFSGGGGSAAAGTAVMNFAATGFTVAAGGTGFGTGASFAVLTVGGIVPGNASAVVNPALGPSLFTPRQANILGTSGTGNITATGSIVVDGGMFQAVPTGIVVSAGGNVTVPANVTINVGGQTDSVVIQPF